MVATTAKKTPKSPAKKAAGNPAPIIGKGKLDSPLSSPTPSQRSRGRITVKSPEPADSDGDARSPTKRLTPGRGAKSAAIALLAEQGKYELDTDAHGEAKSKRGRAAAKDDDFDVAMEEQDPFADDLTCALLPYTLISQLLRVISVKHGRGGDGSAPAPVPVGHKGGVSGVEAFTFDYKVEWPLSIVLSSYALTKYQVTHQTTSLLFPSALSFPYPKPRELNRLVVFCSVRSCCSVTSSTARTSSASSPRHGRRTRPPSSWRWRGAGPSRCPSS